jgi:tetratricopeptide (TPR) repeat protein
MSALEQAIDESATVTVRWKDREFEVEASGMDDEEELVIAVSNKIHLAPEHLRLTWAVDGACVATAIDDAPEVESESDDELLEPVVIRELPRDPAAEPAKARDHSLTNYDKYGTMYVEAEKDLDPDFKEEKPKFAKRAATALLKKFAESKAMREEGNRCATRGDFSKACDKYERAMELAKFSMDWNNTEVQEGRKYYIPAVVNKAYCHLMLAPKWGETQYEKCIEKCDEAIRLGQAAKAHVMRECDEQDQVHWLREFGASVVKAYLRKGMAHHARRDYVQAHRALDTCIHCDFDQGLNMIAKETGVAKEAHKERKKLLVTQSKYPPREKKRKKRIVS